jgi:glycosyltransferase 2 family protein
MNTKADKIMDSALKNRLKLAVKLVVSALILWIIIRKLDWEQLGEVLLSINPIWLFGGVLFFVISKIISAYRFNILLTAEGVYLSDRINIKLYWLGMYYNLLLPGGISGDGYKVKLLKDHFKISVKKLLKIILLDRVSGLFALGLIFLLLLPFPEYFRPWLWLCVLLLFAAIAGGYYFFHFFGKHIDKIFLNITMKSLLVQMMQILCVLCIIQSFGKAENFIAYILLFLISSVVAMVPVTIGGAGARELTFLYGAGLMNVQNEVAVGIAFVFYLISTCVALYGVRYSFKPVLPQQPG